MKKYLAATAVIIIFLAVFIPLASSNPDGLEKVVSTFGVKEEAVFWQGLMPDYSFALVENSYVSTLLAGIFGTLMVLLTTLLLGKVMVPKSGKIKEN